MIVLNSRKEVDVRVKKMNKLDVANQFNLDELFAPGKLFILFRHLLIFSNFKSTFS